MRLSLLWVSVLLPLLQTELRDTEPVAGSFNIVYLRLYDVVVRLFHGRKLSIHRLGFFLGPGQMVEPVTNHTQRAGFVITTGKSREEAVARATRFVETVEIETVPLIKYEFAATLPDLSS